MSRLTNVAKINNRSNVKTKEYGNQSYRSGVGFAEQMRIATEKAKAQLSDIKESEMVRPYTADSYEEMEYYLVPEAGMYSVPTADLIAAGLHYDVPWTDPYVGQTFEGYWEPLTAEELSVSTYVGTFYPAVNGDDGRWATSYDAEFKSSLVTIDFGRQSGGVPLHNWIRFPNDIPAGATIKLATIAFLSTGNQSEDYVNTKVHFNAHDAAVAPTNRTEANALALTTGVTWSAVEHWVSDQWHTAPPLKADLQEVIARPGRKDGDAVMFVLKDNVTGYPPTPIRQYWAHEQEVGTPGVQPQLQVIWEI